MTAAAQSGRPSSRPSKPPRSWAVPIGLDVGALIEDAGSGTEIWAEFLEPDWAFLPETIDPLIETFQMAVIAAFVGCAVALPISFLASRVTTPNVAAYLADRGVLS